MSNVIQLNSRPVVTFPEGQPAIWCPVCEVFHEFHWGPGKNALGDSWRWNENVYVPTFDPAGVFKIARGGRVWVCNCWVHDGKITYLQQTTHKAVGQTMELQPYG